MHKLNINESFICKIWEGAGEYLTGLKTTDGDEIEIIEYGKKNYDSGPDYINAKIKINGKLQIGHVEIHQDFKHWFQHKHPQDEKYIPVILQVVLWDSKNRKLPKLKVNRDLPTVILANHLKYSIHYIWQEIINKPSPKTKLPCANLNYNLNDEDIKTWFSALAMERLMLKSSRIKERLLEIEKENKGKTTSGYLKNKSHWEQVLYEFVFEALGFSKNKEQMLKLSNNFRLQITNYIINKNKKDTAITLQALLFGLSGLLDGIKQSDFYVNRLKEIWYGMRPEFKKVQMSGADWNFFRLRPQNFPTRRIAYGAQFILKIINEDLLKEIITLFQNNELKPKEIYRYLSMFLKPGKDFYWNKHYNFGKKASGLEQLLGAQRIEDIIVNVITPLVYLYADIFAKRNLKERIIEFYTGLKTKPDNSIVKLINSQLLKKRKININTPSSEQAAIQLYRFYCTRRRCDECDIGKIIFKDTGYDYKIIYY